MKRSEFDLLEFQKDVHQNAVDKGFWEKNRNVYEKLALIHSEVSEALESLRNREVTYFEDDKGKPEGVGPELADVIIRTLDLCEFLGINTEEMLVRKHAYNKTRPKMHGGKDC